MEKWTRSLAGLLVVSALFPENALAVKAPLPMTTNMANQLVQAYGAKKGVRSLRLNEFRQARVALRFRRQEAGSASSAVTGGGTSPMGTIYFSVVNENEMRAYISIFREPMISNRRDGYFDRINSQIKGQNTGGAQMVYVSDAKTYYLAKTYRKAVPVHIFLADVAAMEQAAGRWTLGIVPKLQAAAKRRVPVPAQRGTKIAYWRLE